MESQLEATGQRNIITQEIRDSLFFNRGLLFVTGNRYQRI